MVRKLLIGRVRKSLPFRWIFLAIVFWTAIGLIFALPRLRNGSPLPIMLTSLSEWWAWGLLTPFIVMVDRRLLAVDEKVRLRSLAHLLLAPLFTAGNVLLVAIFDALFGLRPWSQVFEGLFALESIEGMFWSMLVYLLIVGSHRAYLFQRRYSAAELRAERLERAFTQARLNVLRMQLDPHFLFNALNTISAQVEREPRLARQMIGHLGDLLRVSLESNHRQEISFREELSFLGHYIAIQKSRFGDKLKIDIDISPDIQRALVPNLFLQPLVENAIRHGISKRSSGGVIRISARNVDSRIDIRVLDDGLGLPPGWSAENAEGLGLSLTRQRIMALNEPGSAFFALHRRPEGGTVVEISFPLRLTEGMGRVISAA